MRELSEVFSFGTIFRMSYKGTTEEYYVLCVAEPHTASFALMNLKWGSRLAEARRYDGDITWGDILEHASFFTSKCYVLEPMKNCTISGTVMPSTPHTKVSNEPIGAEK